VQDEDRSLLRGEALEEDEHRQRQRVAHLGVLRGVIGAVGDDRFWQPLADVAFAAGAR
jgi:hypothetical protein